MYIYLMKHKVYHVIGMMSGTSLDGIDLIYLKFSFSETWQYCILQTESKAYPKPWKEKLRKAHTLPEAELTKLNTQYTVFLAERISQFIDTHHITALDAVCSHGHTVLHQPANGLTLQIGNLSLLAEKLQHTVVCDFRMQDVTLGGQGAPLVPIGDQLLFSDYDYCLNLGGFANISTEKEGKRTAYDICPVNTVLNFYAEKLGFPFDEGGKIAASGTVNIPLLQQLNRLAFYQEKPPKSLGIEWVNAQIPPILKATSLSEKDLLATFTEHVAHQIAQNLSDDPKKKCLCTGGGVYNRFLMQRIQEKSKTQLVIPNANLVEYKEALIFGLLGVLKLRGEINVLSSVTGASSDHSSGVIWEGQSLV